MSLFRSSPSAHTLTLWANWEEWKECKKYMFTTTDEEGEAMSAEDIRQCRQKAVDMVSGWRARGRVPLAVDCTAQIVQLNLQHNYPNPQNGAASTPLSMSSFQQQQSTLSSRMQYSLCLLRLVNGLLDPQQQKQHAQSINSLAKQMNLPRLLVDLRHESTHQSLPSLPLLQLASLSALEWLHRHYWSAQHASLSKVEDLVRTQLNGFKKIMERAKGKNNATDEQDEGEEGEGEQEGAAESDLGDGMLLLTEDKSTSLPSKAQDALQSLYSSLSSGNTIAHTQALVSNKLVPTLLSTQFLIRVPKQSRLSPSALFRRLMETWDPALQFLTHKFKSQQLQLQQLLLRRIVERLAKEGKGSVRVGAAGKANASLVELALLRDWAVHLLRHHGAAMFKQGRQQSQEAESDSSSRKRSHSDMQSSSSPASPLDELTFLTLRHLNLYLAPLLPFLVPLFKAHYPHKLHTIQALEQLLHVHTRTLYPNHKMPLPKGVGLHVKQAQAPAEAMAAVRSFLSSQASSSPATSSPAASPAAPSSSSSSSFPLLTDFPFLPLGLAAPHQPLGELLLEDEEWLSPADLLAQQTPVPAAVPASAAAAAVVEDDTASASVERMEEAESEEDEEAMEVAPSNKRARPSPTPSAASAAPSAESLALQQAALQRLQQTIAWM